MLKIKQDYFWKLSSPFNREVHPLQAKAEKKSSKKLLFLFRKEPLNLGLLKISINDILPSMAKV
jgi:hypothetical protein